MQLESHLAVGWLMGNLVGGADRRFRALVAFSALAPDLDGISFLFGQDAYARAHHVYGHNVFAGAFFTILCAFLARPGWKFKTALFAALGFASHYVGDYFFSGWPIMTFWPISREEVKFHIRMGLDHPVNHALSFASLAMFVITPFFWKRTVFETLWPSMDRLLSGLTLPRTQACAICGTKTAQRCANCGKPLCLKHAKITRKLLLSCPDCSSGSTVSQIASP